MSKNELITELNFPFKQPNDRVIGSCNDWVCIVNEVEDDIILWNMSTEEYHLVPYTPDESPRVWDYKKHSQPTYGFGYDSINDDYKLLRVQQFIGIKDHTFFKSEAMVYSVKRNSWRKTKGLPCYIHSPQESGVFVGCALHWVAATEPSCNVPTFILAFDVAAEKCRKVPLPEGMGFQQRFTVGVSGGCLCVTTCSYKASVDVWVMKESRIKQVQDGNKKIGVSKFRFGYQ